MKLCKDCKFFNATTAKCNHETAVIWDYVNGDHRFHSAQIHRSWAMPKDCGPEAKHFEPKPVDVAPQGWAMIEAGKEHMQ